MATSKPVLTYFNGRGLGEPARLILAEAAVEYEDNRVSSLDELKKSGKLAFGQVPLWEENGFTMVQSQSIARYLARKYGLYGKTEQEGALADMIVDGVNDVRLKHYNAKTDEEKAKFQKEVLPQWIPYFETLLGKNKSGFFVGDKITYADIYVYYVFDLMKAANASAFESAPLLSAHIAAIGARPNIKAWVEKRPVTNF